MLLLLLLLLEDIRHVVALRLVEAETRSILEFTRKRRVFFCFLFFFAHSALALFRPFSF